MHKVLLSSIIDLISGGTPKTSHSEYWENGNIGWLSVTDFNDDYRFVYNSEKKITEMGVKNSNTKFLEKGDLIISARGTVGALAQIGKPMCFNQSCFGIRAKKGKATNDFLYYALKNYVRNIQKRGQGSVFNTINLASFDLMEIEIPKNIELQQKIANALSSLDSKIELNNKINKELEAMAKTLYDYWFVQFDFPDENGKPYKSSGGKMVYNLELKREIPEGWKIKTISELLNVVTGKEDANFAVENGKYPFFTCSENILSCDEYAFEGKAILIAGNGNFNVKIYEGKFNAYQRTYVLIPNDEKFYSVIFYAVKDQLKKLSNGSAGSIIKFITKGDVDNIPLVLPTNGNYKIFDKLNNITALIEQNIEQNQELAKLRDWLLPMLMNGQVRVK